MDTAGQPSIADLRSRLAEVSLRDGHRLRSRIDDARKRKDPGARVATLRRVEQAISQAEERLRRRRTNVPKITFLAELPVSAHRDQLAAAIRDHQVVVVAGETGSGKTTQLPKICLELGRGVRGQIGHTQPRRLAARTVAERIASELSVPLGGAIGYQVRFTDTSGDDTLVKLMTDGILLAEIQSDRSLRNYDTLIIDEAHERSLNVDFLLGYLKQLLPRRPDLKVIITSATIDPERFARHFDDAPVVEVSGRTYPVEVRYRPLDDDGDGDQVQGILDAVEELPSYGDILVFCSGEREIRDAADALRKQNLRNTEILPLFARLSAAEQHRVFQPHQSRHIVIATNVAETSLTVPGVRYVIDPGTARISRYSHRTKVQRLPIEAISQASANQRAGRCGRTSDGICIRLYDEENFDGRPEFTEPEILRTNLASVILQMTSLALGDMAAFPFLDPPDPRQVRDGVALLHELGALDGERQDRLRLTATGRTLAQLPIDPRLARMLIEADRNACLSEVLIIVAAMAIQDPRERPADQEQAADTAHARFADETSDFLAYLNLWRYLRDRQIALSGNQFRRLCRTEFLHFLRIREWQDLHAQLRQAVRDLGMTPNKTPSDNPEHLHTALLAGLLSHIGLRDPDKRDYLGGRGARFGIFPGSALFKKQPQWVMASELVETTRLWGRTVAAIKPEWAEPLAQHLIRRTYSEPHWERKPAAVMASERVTLYGVPIVASRKVNYGRIDPEIARDLFIRHALVEGDWDTHHTFFHDNRALLGEVEELEDRVRRRDILVDDEALFSFYDSRIDASVVSGAHFDSWWKDVRRDQPDLLDFSREMLISDGATDVSETDYPDVWRQGELALPLTYQFEPGTAADGVTVHIPLTVLNQIDDADFAWQIPGLRHDLVTALIRSLPKHIRRELVPAPDWATALLSRLTRQDRFYDALSTVTKQLTGVQIRDWPVDRVPDHLRVTFEIEDERGRSVAAGKDLATIKDKLVPKTRDVLSAASGGLERRGLTRWDFGELPHRVEHQIGANLVRGFPALVDEGDSVAIRIFDTETAQQQAMWRGTRRLVLLGSPSPIKPLLARLDNRTKLALSHNPHGGVPALLDDCIACAADSLIDQPAWDAAAFEKLLTRVRSDLPDAVLDVVRRTARLLTTAYEVHSRLAALVAPVYAPAVEDIRAQWESLVYKGFVTDVRREHLDDVLRYLEAIDHRLERLPSNAGRDLGLMRRVQDLEDAYAEVPPDDDVRWMLEELRVSYFAQPLGTRYSVSEKRVRRAIESLR